jgi:hypothetical protein
MGIFDRLFGRKEKTNKKQVQPKVAKREKSMRRTIGRKDRINRVEICFESKPPLPYSERRAIEELISYFDLAKSFTHDVHISASFYKMVPGVAESLRTGECTEELFRFVSVQLAILGMMDDKEWEKVIPRPFTVGGTLGVLIAGKGREPWRGVKR